LGAPQAPANVSPSGGPPPGSSGPPGPHSILSEKLAAALPPPAPEALPDDARAKLAAEKVGLTFKGWRLARLLGLGPVSAAYEATRGVQDGQSRGVVRLMVGSLAANERARSQFVRAAYAASRFQHARVLAVTADGTDDNGAPFVVRPWADAVPLKELLDTEGPMPEARALRLAEQTLDALEIAHAQGIVHGAISPSNVLVTTRGSVRLCDFAAPPGVHARTGEDVLAPRRVTAWTPPERCSAAPEGPTEVGDVWSLGALLYYVVSKTPPRPGATSFADLARTPARPLSEVAQVTPAFAALVMHALEADPMYRYESAYAMLGDVRRVMAGRKPKLGDALRPNPSGPYSAPPVSRSSRQLPASNSRIELGKPLFSTVTKSDHPRKSEWKGNLALILAIAALVGVATFVMVRERVEDERLHNSAPPSPTVETKR
jgi:serine/threonine-protein kinase